MPKASPSATRTDGLVEKITILSGSATAFLTASQEDLI